jgi:hypothetical protein
MDCNGLNQRLDDYLDGLLNPEERAAVDSHVQMCPACRALLAREIGLQRTLRALPAPEPLENFFDGAIRRAIAQDQRHQRRRWRLPSIALAASILLVFTAHLWLKPGPAPVQDIPGLSITLNQVQEINLVFESEHAMQNARFTIQLPEGIELRGYPHQREISWEGGLAQGKNLLVLPVEARSGHGGNLVAFVTHTGKKKNFVLRMEVSAPRKPPITSPATGLEQESAPVTIM